VTRGRHQAVHRGVVRQPSTQRRGARTAFVGFAGARDPDLGAWIEASVAFPNSLLDRITPSVSSEDAARLNAASGLDDRIPLPQLHFVAKLPPCHRSARRPATLIGAASAFL
jgi:sorbose reductase